VNGIRLSRLAYVVDALGDQDALAITPDHMHEAALDHDRIIERQQKTAPRIYSATFREKSAASKFKRFMDEEAPPECGRIWDVRNALTHGSRNTNS